MQHRGVLRRSPIGVDGHLGRPHLRRYGQGCLDLLELHCGRVSELIACLHRLHLALRALRVLFQGGKQSRVARLLVLLHSERLAKRADAIADRLLPGGELSGNVSEAGRLVGVGGSRLQAGDDGTRIPLEQRSGVRQVFDLHYVALDLAPQLLRQRQGVSHHVGVLLQLGLVGLQLRGELLDLLAVLEELVPCR
jgi:hypothetical protein